MICPKCKKQIPEKSLKCDYCKAKVASLCPKCKAYNSIYNLNCVECNNVLLKLCPNCKSVNLPGAFECRKCSYSFVKTEPDIAVRQQQEPIQESLRQASQARKPDGEVSEPQDFEPIQIKFAQKNQQDYSVEFYSQKQASEALTQGILSAEKKIISVNGPKGIGKTIVVKSGISELSEHNIIWLFGDCSALTQLSPCGLIQNVLLSFFNIANFCSDSLKLKKESQKFFHSEFPSLTNEEIFDLLNFLYPVNTDYFENILQNKQKTFVFLEKVFSTIFANNSIVFVVENFDMIDGMSYEFLSILLTRFASSKLKFILTYNDIRPSMGYLYSTDLRPQNYLDIPLKGFDKNQTSSFIDQFLQREGVPDKLKDEIFKLSGSSPSVLEQYANLVSDYHFRNNSFEIQLPSTFSDVIKARLNYLKENPIAYKVLICASILGFDFYPALISQVVKADEPEFIEVFDILQKMNFIVPLNDFSYSFKNSLLWEKVFEEAKYDEEFISINEALFSACSNFVHSSNSLMAIIAQNLNQNLSALNIWTDNIKLSAYIGDTNLYVISQKQCLNLIDKLDNVNNSLIKNNIFERLGKLLTSINPQEAIEYLSSSVVNVKKMDNPIKEIELTGYLAKCCIDLGNYYGTIECIDSAIAKLDYGLDLEIAMLKSRKLDALLNIGNCGEIVNLVDNEIMPIFDKYISAKPHKTIPIQSLYKAWLKTYLALANALIMQGNTRYFTVLTMLFDIFEKNHFDDKVFICKAKLALAFANTIKGYVENSEQILEEIIKLYKTDYMDNESISRWNFINILNNFIQKKYVGLQEELFQVVTFAHNNNDNFTKNILKSLLGKLLKDEENAKKAMSIYSEQITYFAKEKNAIGALLTWYLIADANLVVDGPDKALEVAQKALDVAQGPKIENYLFIILFNKIIAKAFMAKSDYEMAKVHIERAIMVARKFELLDMLSGLYLLYGKYLQDIALIKSDSQLDYALGASKMYKKALSLAQEVKNPSLIAKVDKAKSVLSSFCQLNGITLEDK